jgi:hypothetical protein
VGQESTFLDEAGEECGFAAGGAHFLGGAGAALGISLGGRGVKWQKERLIGGEVDRGRGHRRGISDRGLSDNGDGYGGWGYRVGFEGLLLGVLV